MSDSESDERQRIRSVVQKAKPHPRIQDKVIREGDKESKDHKSHVLHLPESSKKYQLNKLEYQDDVDISSPNYDNKPSRRMYRSDSENESDNYKHRKRYDMIQKYRGDSDDGHNRENRRVYKNDKNSKRRRDEDYEDRERYDRRKNDKEDKRGRDRRSAHLESRRKDDPGSYSEEGEVYKRQRTALKNEKKETEDSQEAQKQTKEVENDGQKKKVNADNPLATRTGGAYIPPAKLRMMQESITDKSSEAYQRLSWEALKKSINGLINKVNTPNISNIIRELFQENIVRGRGILAQSIVRAQAASPTFSHVYAALVAILNTKFPKNGELILRRLVLQFRRAYRRNDKTVCLSGTRFIAHLVNQQVAHEILALEILTLLLQKPTDDSVEVAIGFLKECGLKLSDVSPRGIHAVFERLRSILHSSDLEKRVQYMIEVMFAIRKDGFKDHPSVIEELDLVEEEDQITHLLRLEEVGTAEDILNVFKMDPNFLENEEKYKEIKKDILGDSSDDSSGHDGDSDDNSDDDEEAENEEGKMDITDMTETNLVALRRTIYLTIQSSLDYEECAHKMLKMDIKADQMGELCTMIVDCCAQQRTYEKFFGLLAQRFCQLNKEFVEHYMRIFREQYDTIHRLETNKLRNVSKFFAHLLFTDAIPWTVLASINLNEEDTTSSSRIFIKILFQELAEYMGLPKLNDRLKDPFLAEYFEGLFPRDNPRNTRFAINFFTAIGLGGLTDELREHLKNAPKMIMAQTQQMSSDSSSDSSDSSDDSSDTDESNSESSSSESDDV